MSLNLYKQLKRVGQGMFIALAFLLFSQATNAQTIPPNDCGTFERPFTITGYDGYSGTKNICITQTVRSLFRGWMSCKNGLDPALPNYMTNYYVEKASVSGVGEVFNQQSINETETCFSYNYQAGQTLTIDTCTGSSEYCAETYTLAFSDEPESPPITTLKSIGGVMATQSIAIAQEVINNYWGYSLVILIIYALYLFVYKPFRGKRL